jgi:hypothetical protein
MLKNGITFEESGNFLKWGVFINPLIQKYNGSKENLGDRTAYNWGKQTILNGLELELTTCFWNFGFQRWFRRFTEMVQRKMVQVGRYERWGANKVIIQEGNKPMVIITPGCLIQVVFCYFGWRCRDYYS